MLWKIFTYIEIVFDRTSRLIVINRTQPTEQAATESFTLLEFRWFTNGAGVRDKNG